MAYGVTGNREGEGAWGKAFRGGLLENLVVGGDNSEDLLGGVGQRAVVHGVVERAEASPALEWGCNAHLSYVLICCVCIQPFYILVLVHYRGNSKYHYYGIRVKPGSSLTQFAEECASSGRQQNSQKRFKFLSNSSQKSDSQYEQGANNSTSSHPNSVSPQHVQHHQYLGDGSGAIPDFPEIEFNPRLSLPEDCTLEDVDTLRSIYREHCEAFLDAIVNLEFQTVESLWREFWRSQNNNGDECEEEKYLSKTKLYLLCKCPPVQLFVRQVDYLFYQNLVDVLIPDVLRPIPMLCGILSTFPSQLCVSDTAAWCGERDWFAASLTRRREGSGTLSNEPGDLASSLSPPSLNRVLSFLPSHAIHAAQRRSCLAKGSLTQAIRNFAKGLESWLTQAMSGCPEEMIHIKVSAVSAFAQTLRRYTSLNHLAQAARAVLQNSSQINQMLVDLNRVDFHNVQEQSHRSYLDKELPGMWSRFTLDGVSVLTFNRCSVGKPFAGCCGGCSFHSLQSGWCAMLQVAERRESPYRPRKSWRTEESLCRLRRVLFGHYLAILLCLQASWVCQCDDDVVQRLEADFKVTLQQQNSLEQWAAWLKQVVTQILEPYVGKPNFAKAARQFLLKWSFYSVVNWHGSLAAGYKAGFGQGNFALQAGCYLWYTWTTCTVCVWLSLGGFMPGVHMLQNRVSRRRTPFSQCSVPKCCEQWDSGLRYQQSLNIGVGSEFLFPTQGTTPPAAKHGIEGEHQTETALEKQNTLVFWAFFSSHSSMVIRDLTLRSAASFGSFHLIRLLYDEYMFFLIEHQVALETGETPIAVMGEHIPDITFCFRNHTNKATGKSAELLYGAGLARPGEFACHAPDSNLEAADSAVRGGERRTTPPANQEEVGKKQVDRNLGSVAEAEVSDVLLSNPSQGLNLSRSPTQSGGRSPFDFHGFQVTTPPVTVTVVTTVHRPATEEISDVWDEETSSFGFAAFQLRHHLLSPLPQ
ncbi:hypothetical protein PR048_007738 [Dryococelus australis]|uniref:RFX1-4/6/8-like BCD domain-containing protein n=1 Tax=Dryococelus australis TaxID=614101 RepID=A0ABQ9HV62_9NEOP|nr:hypothetical protein PR048_007738 [Dryococelus australis]